VIFSSTMAALRAERDHTVACPPVCLAGCPARPCRQ
jgi:hypothetical protein